MWSLGVYETRSGAHQLDLPVSAGSWTRRLNGQGTGQFTIPLFGSGLTPASVDELATGGKYTLALRWGDHVAYAGVIQSEGFAESSKTLDVPTKEIRAALFAQRSFFGVNQYNPASEFTIAGRNASGAVRAVVQAVLAPSAEWSLPIDLPADGSGSYEKKWRHVDAAMFEDMIRDIETRLGVEVDWVPVLSSGALRYQTRVGGPIQAGDVLDLAGNAPMGAVTDFSRKRDYSQVVTGVGVFGDGKDQDRIFAYAPTSGSGATDSPVRDVFISDTTLKTVEEAQQRANAEYEARRYPTVQWSVDVNVWPLGGPAVVAPGRRLRLWTYGSSRIPDGPTDLRVVALSGDLGWLLKPEVQ